MLSPITWNHFFVVLTSSIALYYCATTLLLYSAEIIQRIKSWGSRSNSNSERPPAEVANAQSIIGDAVSEIPRSMRKSEGSAEDLLIDEAVPGESIVPAATDHSKQIQSVADLIDQIKLVFQQATDNDATADDIQSLLSTLLDYYPHLKGTSYQEALSIFIHEASLQTTGLTIPLDDARQLWNDNRP